MPKRIGIFQIQFCLAKCFINLTIGSLRFKVQTPCFAHYVPNKSVILVLCWVTQAEVDSGRLGAQQAWLWQLGHYLCLLWPFSHLSRATHLAFPASSDHPEAISKGFICPPQIGTTHHHGCWNRHTCVCVWSFLGLIMLDQRLLCFVKNGCWAKEHWTK